MCTSRTELAKRLRLVWGLWTYVLTTVFPSFCLMASVQLIIVALPGTVAVKPWPPGFRSYKIGQLASSFFQAFTLMLIFSIERLGGQNLDSQRKYHTVFMAYRSINALAPEYLSKLLANSNSVTSYSLGDTEEQTNFSSAQHKLALAIEVGVSGAV